MTFRAKPVVKRAPKHSWESRDRRNFYLNLGFGLVVVAAVLILLIAVAANYYNENLASVGSVDGQSISKAELRDRVADRELAPRRGHADAIRTLTVAGRLTQAQADAQNQIIAQQVNQIVPISLERLIDNRLQATLAGQQGVTVTDADIDARLTEEATTPASRHGWVIEVAPETSRRRHRADRRPGGRGQGQGRDRARRPAGRQGLGGRRQGRLHRRLDRAAGRRPRLDRRKTTARPTRRSSRRSTPPRSTRRPRSSRATTASSASAA